MMRLAPEPATTSRARKEAVQPSRDRLAIAVMAMLLTATTHAPADEPDAPRLPDAEVRQSLHAMNLDDRELLRRINGSTSAQPLMTLIIAALQEREPGWTLPQPQRLLAIDPQGGAPPYPHSRRLRRIIPSGTHRAYLDLIEGRIDFALTAREPSEDELALVAEHDQPLDVQPVAMDAFVFIVHPDNPVEDLTLDEIRGIFRPDAIQGGPVRGRFPVDRAVQDGNVGEPQVATQIELEPLPVQQRIANWTEVGGEDMPIRPITRDRNSGSQQLMIKLVMQDRPIIAGRHVVHGMLAPIGGVATDPGAISYSVHYYRRYMTTEFPGQPGDAGHRRPLPAPRMIAVDGVHPTPQTIADGTYPLREPVWVVIREDTPADHWARRLRDWLFSNQGQQLVAASGYVPIDEAAPLPEQGSQGQTP